MQNRSRVPGGFSRQFQGRRQHYRVGWRDFDPGTSAATLEDPNNQVDSVTTTTDGRIVVTFTDALTGENKIHEMACITIPLTNKQGQPVMWTDAFVLKTQVEFISITGDWRNGAANQHTPVWGLGICKNQTDIDGSSSANKFIGRGLHILQVDGSGDPKFRTYVGKSNQATNSSQGDSSNLGVNTKQVISEFYVGPAVGADTSLKESVYMTGWAGNNATGSYAKNTNINLHSYGITHNDAVPDTDTQVYLFAFFGSIDDTDGSNDPAVLTCKLRYMCNSNFGKGGTGV